MTAQEFLKSVQEKSDCISEFTVPFTDAQYGLDVLFKHFLGEDYFSQFDWITVGQGNTKAIYEILKRYPKRKLFAERLRRFFRKD